MTHHPVMADMLQLGCKSQYKTTIAFQVYLELSESLALWDLDYHYNEELDLFYMSGRRTKSSVLEIFIPISCKETITTSQMETMQNALCNTGTKTITLAIKEKDSTVVLYSIQQGLVTPESPEKTKERKRSKDRRSNIDWKIKKDKESIYLKTINGSESELPKDIADDESDSFAGEL